MSVDPPTGPPRSPRSRPTADSFDVAEPAGSARTGPPLATQLGRLIDRVQAAAREDGELAAAAALDTELLVTRHDSATVIVVGEKNRGKSSLINALVERAPSLPVDADIATCAHIAVRYGNEPAARVFDTEHPEGRTIPVDSIGDYAALDPVAQRPRHDGVSRVELSTPAPLLAQGLQLVDTPGVGGLVAGHAALTLAALERADALLFVLDGQSEITASELAFLKRSTERIATMSFAVTKTDLHPEWRAILQRNQELLVEHAPRYSEAPWFPVSNRAANLAARARDAGRDDVAERWDSSSGLAALREFLSALASSSEHLRTMNAAHHGARLAAELVDIHTRRVQSLILDPGFTQRITTQKAALSALQTHTATWRQTLTDRTTRIERTARNALARHVEDLRRETGERIATAGKDVVDILADDLPPRVEAVWLEIDTLLRRELSSTADALLADLDDVHLDVAALVPHTPQRLVELPPAIRSKGQTSFAEYGATTATLGLTAGRMVAGAALGVLGGPVGIALGVAVGGPIAVTLAIRRYRKEQTMRGREDARRYLTDVVSRVNTEAGPAVAEAIASARELLASHITQALATQKRRLNSALADHEKNLATERSTLEKNRHDAEEHLRRRTALHDDAVAFLQRIELVGGMR